jgi:enoyl-CoA hydratase/carnithine racemase
MSAPNHPILVETTDRIAVITVNRPEKRNAFTMEMFRLLAEAFTAADGSDDVACVVLRAAGSDFTTGLDLMDVAPAFMQGQRPYPETAVDPWAVIGRHRRKPLVMAVQGRCFTLGFELALAADTCIAARGTVFALKEVRIGIVPAGGGVFRFVQAAGWSSAMRYVLTGDDLPVDEAYRLHLVQEVVDPGSETERAMAVARSIAAAAPLAVGAAIEQARAAVFEGWKAAIATIPGEIQRLIGTEDAREAAMAMVQRRPPRFAGR